MPAIEPTLHPTIAEILDGMRRNFSRIRRDGARKQSFWGERQKILQTNYWPIFHIASDIISSFSSRDIFGRAFQHYIIADFACGAGASSSAAVREKLCREPSVRGGKE